MGWSLSRKVSATLIAILLFTMMVTALVGYDRFADEMSSLVRSRYSFVAFTIKKKVEDSLNLGFALRQLRQVQDTLELEKVRDDQILGLQVFDARGEVLFDSDRGQIGSTVPESWVAALAQAGGQPFAPADADANVVALPLVNTLGKLEGGVVLLYPAGYVERELGPVLMRLTIEMVALVGAFAVATLVVARFALGGVRQRLRAMEIAVTDAAGRRDDRPMPVMVGTEFGGRFGEFVGKTREVMDHLSDATDEVERLDRLT